MKNFRLLAKYKNCENVDTLYSSV